MLELASLFGLGLGQYPFASVILALCQPTGSVGAIHSRLGVAYTFGQVYTVTYTAVLALVLALCMLIIKKITAMGSLAPPYPMGRQIGFGMKYLPMGLATHFW